MKFPPIRHLPPRWENSIMNLNELYHVCTPCLEHITTTLLQNILGTCMSEVAEIAPRICTTPAITNKSTHIN